MFEFLKKLWIAYYRLTLGCMGLMLIIAGLGAILNFAWLAAQGRLHEAATEYIFVAVFGAVVAFAVWVHRDATTAGRRLEKHLQKTPAATEEEDDDEQDAATSSEHIRPAPGQDR